MKKNFLIPLFLLSFSCHNSLSQVASEQSPGQDHDTTTTPEKVKLSYELIHDRVLKTNCLGCHSTSGGTHGGLNLETYEQVLANIELIKEEVKSKNMPPRNKPQLSENQIQLLMSWIDSGAQLTEPNPGIFFEEVFNRVIKSNCLKCHSSQMARGDIVLETYQQVFDIRGTVQSVIESGEMPTRRGTPLTEDQKTLILTWLSNGAPEKESPAVNNSQPQQRDQ